MHILYIELSICFQAPRDLVAHPDNLEVRDSLEVQVQQDGLGQLDSLDPLVRVDSLDHLVLMVQQERLVYQDLQDFLEVQEDQEPQVYQGCQETKVTLVHKAFQEDLVSMMMILQFHKILNSRRKSYLFHVC